MRPGEQMFSDHDCAGEAAAYALGALEPSEAAAFREHLEQCAVCRDEVEAFTGVVQAMPMSAPQHPAPRRLRRRVMQAVRDEPRSQSVRPRRRWFASIASTPRSALASAAVVAVVVLGVLAGVELSSSGTSGRVVQAQVSGISGTAQLRVADGRGELIVRRLTPPPAGHVYEVWLKAADAPPVPASVLFSVSASGSADVGLPGSLRGIGQVLVTPEPEGGSPQPTHAPVIVAPVT